MSDPQTTRGHELEASNPKKLFLGLGLAATVIGIAVVFAVQLAYGARNDARWAAAERGSMTREEHAARVAGELEGIDAATAAVVADPTKLQHSPEPPGFVHPDQIKGVGRFTPGLAPLEAPPPADPGEAPPPADPGAVPLAPDRPAPGEPATEGDR